jgi:phage pi2 protein 07
MHESPTINNHILKYLLFLPDISVFINAKNNVYLYIEKEAFTNCKSKFNSMSLKAILKKYFENCTVNRDRFKEGE